MHYQLAEKMNVIDMFFIELTKYVQQNEKVILFLIYKLQGCRPWGVPPDFGRPVNRISTRVIGCEATLDSTFMGTGAYMGTIIKLIMD